MAAPSEYSAILSGEARPVDVVAIEGELRQLWTAAAQDVFEGHPVVRACVLSLVAYAPGDGVARHISEVLAQVSGRHPSRSIVIVAESGTGAPLLQAAISAHCQIAPEGGKQVCSEQITLRASGPAVGELHSTVVSLLVPDLPVFLWWHEEPSLESHLFQELLETSDRLVVDSADFAPESAASSLAALQRLAREGTVAVSDLNWSRLNHWRELVAQFFDTPPARQHLDRLKSVNVEVAPVRGSEPGFIEGLLLVGWLASRLGWTLEKGGKRARDGALAFDLRSAVGSVHVELKPVPGRPRGGLLSVLLGAAGGVSFSISRDAKDYACVVVAAGMRDGGGPPRAVRMDLPSEAALLCEELEMLADDSVYREALDEAVRFMEVGR